MIEFLAIFSVAAVGSLVRLSADLALKIFVRKTQSDTIAAGSGRSWVSPALPIDPALRFGFILACDGALVLAFVSALPGELALERTGLTFALLCVGGLIGEICSSATSARMPDLEADEHAAPHPIPTSRRLSVALTLILNLCVAVLCTDQGLIEIVPPKTLSAARVEELDPVIVIAQRSYDPLEERAASY
jgi:hypothetical protein